MVDSVKRGATYQDVLDAPPHMVAELIDGELHLQPRPAKPHARTMSILGGLLVPPFDLGRAGPGGWWILDEPELHLGADGLVPDIAGWRRTALATLDTRLAYFTEVPDWVCEIVSPTTERKDRRKKLPLYGQAGVTHAWLIDPVKRTLEVLERQGAQWHPSATFAGRGAVRAAPFGAIELPLADLWLP